MPVTSHLMRFPFKCIAKSFHSSCRSKRKFTVTTPIFYCNAGPHIGHLYTAVLADAATRFHNLLGERDSCFVTGTDEHGTKIFQAATANKMSPKDYCDKISSEYRQLFAESEIGYTHFIRTTQDDHIQAVNSFWKCLNDGNFIYKGSYSGWYCVADEAFLTDAQVKEGSAQGDGHKISIDSGQPVEWTTEENFMFRLSSFKSDLLYWLQKENVVKPENFHRALVKWLEENDLEDLSVSRPASRVPWGLPVPDNPNHTIYVWLDALVNYLTAAGYPNSQNFTSNWPPTVQILGKDILKFHGIYWPAFLMAAGLEPPHQLLVHSHWTVDSEKMSKSRGNVVSPPSPTRGDSLQELLAMRYFLLRTGTPQKDNNFSKELMISVANTELMGAIGNLLSRCTAVALNPKQEYPPHEDRVPSIEEWSLLSSAVEKLPGLVRSHYSDCNFYLGVVETLKVIDLANQFFTHMEPWKFSKEQLAAGVQNPILHVTMEALRVCGIALQPIIPSLASTLLSRLGVPDNCRMWQDMENVSWKGGPSATGYKLGLGNIKLFERVGESPLLTAQAKVNSKNVQTKKKKKVLEV
ncbi:methionine--tRNA ligase, mitochondrial [Thrips palmi]|uniref:Methionine--tRNA ligase, mitochondrial n=1 Tax=Thrips palmi TaxID=161013 RepID=A0A6P9A4G9_THRPL|nr:methionine--tRNA ligase, mitochondrial [Thrips palmi]